MAFNDMFVVWSTSESFTGNVTFIDEQPLTVTALDPYMTIKPGDPLLAGTGFPDSFDDTGRRHRVVHRQGLRHPRGDLHRGDRHLRHGRRHPRHHRPHRQLPLGLQGLRPRARSTRLRHHAAARLSAA
jgi:hypothetical protein